VEEWKRLGMLSSAGGEEWWMGREAGGMVGDEGEKSRREEG
jgi:hypothetical protein